MTRISGRSGNAGRQGGVRGRDLAEARAERDVGLAAHMLVAEEHNLPAQQRVPDAPDAFVVEVGRQVDAADLGARVLGQRQDFELA